MNKLYILKIIGAPIPEVLAALLYCAAQKCAIENLKNLPLRHEHFDGDVRATGKHASLGGIWGQEFSAVIETNRGKINATFIVRHADLEPPLIEFEQILDVTYGDPRAATAHLN